MQYKVDCSDAGNDNLALRICANLKYQVSDSLLVIVYKKLLAVQTTDSARNYIRDLQKDWRMLRDKHCSIVWNAYEGRLGHSKAIAYLHCLSAMTDHRRMELEALVERDQQ